MFLLALLKTLVYVYTIYSFRDYICFDIGIKEVLVVPSKGTEPTVIEITQEIKKEIELHQISYKEVRIEKKFSIKKTAVMSSIFFVVTGILYIFTQP